MKPFDLEKALAGDPVITRDGEKVTELHYFSTSNPDTHYRISAVVNGYIRSFGMDGKWDVGGPNHPNDLFMAPVKKEAWVNVYRSSCGGVFTSGGCHRSQQEAVETSAGSSGYIKTIMIHEWEE